jgi:GNAT superfamily N-acetyltransferase
MAGKETSRERQVLRSKPLFKLRPARAGDLGWIVHRHGVLYAEEQGYDIRFEALVSRIVGEFFERNDTKRERCWIAERHGKNIGCVFVFRKSAKVAKLRMLLVEPEARGMGLGSRLIEECIQFARQADYRKMRLWTHQSLRAARRLYRAAGFRLVKSVPNPSFGRKLVDEFWDLEL